MTSLLIVGVPREVKDGEHRVAITPDGVHELVAHGVHGAHRARRREPTPRSPTTSTTRAGAEIVADADDVWARAGMVLKVKEPQEAEFGYLRPDLVLFTYLHLAAYPAVADALLEHGTTGIAYETVQANGALPLLAPMSEVAGRMATQVGRPLPRARARRPRRAARRRPRRAPGARRRARRRQRRLERAWIAQGMEAEVLLLDKNLDRLRWVDQIHQGRIVTLASNRGAVARAVADADLVIGAVLVPAGRAPVVVTEDMVRAMKPGAVIVDVAVDQGGCVETTHETTHADPVYELHGVLHYAVGNMPGAVPFTSTYALTNATLPYVLQLAVHGVADATAADPALALGVNTVGGKITHPIVAEALGRDVALAAASREARRPDTAGRASGTRRTGIGRQRIVRGRLGLVLIAEQYLFAEHLHIAGGVDAETHLFAAHLEHGHDHVVADHDALVDPAGEYQHGDMPFRGRVDASSLGLSIAARFTGSAEQPERHRPPERLVAVPGAELVVDVGQVGLDRRQRDEQRGRDLAVRTSRREQPEHLPLASGQRHRFEFLVGSIAGHQAPDRCSARRRAPVPPLGSRSSGAIERASSPSTSTANRSASVSRGARCSITTSRIPWPTSRTCRAISAIERSFNTPTTTSSGEYSMTAFATLTSRCHLGDHLVVGSRAERW